MRKIPTLFKRDPEDMSRVTREVHGACGWVLDGEGVATRKYDGTCILVEEDGTLLARREVRPGKAEPAGFVCVEEDVRTGKKFGWEPWGQSSYAKVLANIITHGLRAGTYELIGPKVQGNPEGEAAHRLQRHGDAEVLEGVPRDHDGLVEFLRTFKGEGVVWHHPDGRMAKIKVKDFHRAKRS